MIILDLISNISLHFTSVSFKTFNMKLLVLFIAKLICAFAYQCKDENGQPVDWFVTYKLPELKKSKTDLTNGYAYMYMTPEKNEWVISKKSIQDNDSILGHTLENFYKQPSDFWLSYNDQPDKSSEGGYGHTKGVINADQNGGFWMIHSVPHFPNNENIYSYPTTGKKNGQSILCVNFNASEIDKIGLLLMYNKPYVWVKNTPDDLAELYPNLYSTAQGNFVHKKPWYVMQSLTSVDGFNLEAFAKSGEFGQDLYELVANTLEVDLYVETWRNEPNPLPASCSSKYKVMNINSMNINTNFTFSSHKDHSKLAVSADSSNPFVCIGDINRAKPQESRGGGTMCFKSKKHWLSYFNLISAKDSCSDFYKV